MCKCSLCSISAKFTHTKYDLKAKGARNVGDKLLLILLSSTGCFCRLEEAVVPTTTSTLVPPRAALVERAHHTGAMDDCYNFTGVEQCECSRNKTNFDEGVRFIKYDYHPGFIFPMAFLLILVSTKSSLTLR